MRKYEDNCVGCPKEMGCLASSCPYMNIPVDYCDECGGIAEYHICDEDFCEDCLKKIFNKKFDDLEQNGKEKVVGITANDLLKEVFNDMSLSEQVEQFNKNDVLYKAELERIDI